ncbi:hypothetical protein GALMADRAFT_254315 [Galerina marginata CBS 339.88]|uniref:Uncharacterized protein n=1 Tax=Galerina marginata (strain CBS 339.88) TaxID=685588 RepID=A0A067SWH5_GALM3|nr:hypothetical protein GALMADRAFT_254315 [Galerina marginata CBS 339.88]
MKYRQEHKFDYVAGEDLLTFVMCWPLLESIRRHHKADLHFKMRTNPWAFIICASIVGMSRIFIRSPLQLSSV